MYSKDRFKALEMTISCLRDMEYYEHCQKTLVIDQDADIQLPDFRTIKIPRINNKFRWSAMWDAGVGTARHQQILYLDSDRLLPKNYLKKSLQFIKDDYFTYTSTHFMMIKEADLTLCKNIINKDDNEIFNNIQSWSFLKFEPRLHLPNDKPGKNVMSGNTGFTKNTYYKLKGVDPWYQGHGAFADTDFHKIAHISGCKFIDLRSPEIHWIHGKLDKNDIKLDKISLQKMGLNNYIYYCIKWKLSLSLAEDYAKKSKIPIQYVHDKKKEILEQLKLFPGNLIK